MLYCASYTPPGIAYRAHIVVDVESNDEAYLYVITWIAARQPQELPAPTRATPYLRFARAATKRALGVQVHAAEPTSWEHAL